LRLVAAPHPVLHRAVVGHHLLGGLLRHEAAGMARLVGIERGVAELLEDEGAPGAERLDLGRPVHRPAAPPCEGRVDAALVAVRLTPLFALAACLAVTGCGVAAAAPSPARSAQARVTTPAPTPTPSAPAPSATPAPECGIPAGAVPATGKMIVISLACQELTAYQDGQPFLSTPVTTGEPALPTPTGQYSVIRRNSPFEMVSSWRYGTVGWYAP